MIDEFNSQSENSKFQIIEEENFINLVINHVINNRDDSRDENDTTNKFWLKYRIDLLKFREEKEILTEFKKLIDDSKELIQLIDALVGKLQIIREQWFREHSLTTEELRSRASLFSYA